jgi:anthranilate phosphoribosyltransferase
MDGRGKEKGTRYNTICLNTAPILYLIGKVKNLREGFERAKNIVDSVKAMEKLKQWVREQNVFPQKGEERLTKLLKRIK